MKSGFWKFLTIVFGALLAAVLGRYIYSQKHPKNDPWEESWENSSSPVDLGLDEDSDEADEDESNKDEEKA
ncbi:MAG: hypothetical protein J6S25_01060 [Aeriscardovia sp.]|nr:hypothetical protein [Aeriscardovia sp.]